MLALGGAGRLYGAMAGPAIFLIAQDWLAKLDPVMWQLWLGVLIIVLVLFAPGGLGGFLERRAGSRRARSGRQ